MNYGVNIDSSSILCFVHTVSDCTISKEEMNEAVCESCEKLFWDENKCECKCHTGFQQTLNQCRFNVGPTSLTVDQR